MSYRIVPVSFRAACDFVTMLHRHNAAPTGHKFSIGLADAQGLVGVAMCGRPIARALDDGLTLEVNRTCVLPGEPNANSMLYGAAWRAARAMGYSRMITYTQGVESGASLRAVGARLVAKLDPRGSWAESSVKLRDIRAAKGTGGVERVRWEWSAAAPSSDRA